MEPQPLKAFTNVNVDHDRELRDNEKTQKECIKVLEVQYISESNLFTKL